jgi:dephospho-CoA kinase
MQQMKRPRMVALVGMAGSGKTLCATHLQSRGFFQFRFGSIITDEVERRGLPVNPENERIIREEFRRNEGMDVIARRALPLLRQGLNQHETIIIDGLYSFSEYRTLREELGDDMVVVAVVSARAERYRRLAHRDDRPLTPAEAELRDYQEIEKLEKGGPIAIADYTLINDATPDDLLTKLDELLVKLQIADPA